MSLETGGEDDGVFYCQTSALAEIWTDGMSGVAQDGNAPDDPGKRQKAILNFCADCTLSFFDELWNRIMPAGKEFAQGCIFRQIGVKQGIVGDGVPVDASGAEAQDAKTSSMAVGLGKITILFQAEVASLIVKIEVGHATPNAIGAIAEFVFEAEGFANCRMNTIAGDDEIGLGRGSIFKVKEDGVAALLEAREGVVQVDGVGGQGLGQGELKVGAMNRDAAAIVNGEGESLDPVAVSIFHQKAT